MMRGRSRHWSPLLLVAIVVWGCGGPAGDAVDATTAVARWRVEEVGRIGSIDDPDQSLTAVGQVLIGPAGKLYVAQPQDQDIRVYDTQGALTGIIGRKGKGPGEFGNPGRMGLLGDTLYIADDGLERMSFFTPGGSFLHSIPWASKGSGAPPTLYLPTVPQVLLGNGGGLVRVTVATISSSADHSAVETHEYPRIYLHVNRRGEVIDTVLRHENRYKSINIPNGERPFSLACPFLDFRLDALMLDGRGVVVVDRTIAPTTAPASFRVDLIDPAGDTTFTRSFTYQPTAVPAEVIDRAIERIRERRNMRQAAVPGADVIESSLRHADCIPPTLPPVTRVVTAQDGTIWLRREEEAGDSVFWNVLDREGRLEGRVRLPRAQQVAAAVGDVMVATEEDELGVPYVIRYRLTGTGVPDRRAPAGSSAMKDTAPTGKPAGVR